MANHRPWCTDHLDAPCPVSGEPYEACQAVVEFAPAGVRSSGINVVVYQEQGMSAPLVRVESDLSEMTLAEAVEFAKILGEFVERIDPEIGTGCADIANAGAQSEDAEFRQRLAESGGES